MNNFVKRAPSISSILTVLVTTLAWFAISHHCALGLAMAPAVAEPSGDECPFHSKSSTPAEQKESSASPCCKILRATFTGPAKDFGHGNINLVDIDLAFTNLIVLAPPKIVFAVALLDTGPPGVTSFAELLGSSPRRAPPVRT